MEGKSKEVLVVFKDRWQFRSGGDRTEGIKNLVEAVTCIFSDALEVGKAPHNPPIFRFSTNIGRAC